jgi:hypothetical protein
MLFSGNGQLFFEGHAETKPDGIVLQEMQARGSSFSPVEQRNISMERQTD